MWRSSEGAFFLSFFSSKTTQKALIPRLFPVDLDAPYRDLERTFILRAIKNIEI